MTKTSSTRAAINASIGVPIALVWVDPSAPREVDRLTLAPMPQIAIWMALLSTDFRLDLLQRTGTQALLGEPVIVVDTREGWSEVRLPWQPSSLSPDGYPGWVRSAHLVPLPVNEGGELAIVRKSLREAVRADDGSTLELSFGTILPAVMEGLAIVALRHPNGTTLCVSPDAVDLLPNRRFMEPGEPSTETSRQLLETAWLFLDMPYLWAGLSGYGVDCSGFVHLIYRSAGIRVSRDAHDQAIQGEPVELANALPGDPVFFAGERGVHHVGLTTASGRMLHSPRTGQTVSDDLIASPNYEGEYVTSRSFIATPSV